MDTKHRFLLILLSAGIVAIFILLIFLELFKGSKSGQQKLPVKTINLSPTPTTYSQYNYVKYTKEKNDKLLEIVRLRPSLSADDSLLRKKLINSLGNKSGLLVKTDTFGIEYNLPANVFEAEILSKDLDKAHKEATNWFKDRGFTQDGLCNLPVSFFVNLGVRNELNTKDSEVNPLPDGC